MSKWPTGTLLQQFFSSFDTIKSNFVLVRKNCLLSTNVLHIILAGFLFSFACASKVLFANCIVEKKPLKSLLDVNSEWSCCTFSQEFPFSFLILHFAVFSYLGSKYGSRIMEMVWSTCGMMEKGLAEKWIYIEWFHFL